MFGRRKFSFLDGNTPVDIEAFRSMYEHMYQYVADKTGKRVIVSSASPEEAEILAGDKRFDTAIIHLVRDGYAVTWSYLKKDYNLWDSMLRWFGSNLKIELLTHRVSVPVAIVRYEDFVHDPKGVSERILELVGCSFEQKMFDFRSYAHHRIGGNRMRFGTSNEIREDLSWRRDMPWGARIVFGILFGWANSYYRYRWF